MSAVSVSSLPQLRLRAGGTDLSDSLTGALLTVFVEHQLNQPARCRLEFAEPESGEALDDVVTLGAPFILGIEGPESGLFDGFVDRIECQRKASGEIRWTVEASDPLQALARNGRMRVFVQSTPGELAKELAQAFGMDTEITHDGPMRERVVQRGETDLEFLRALLAEDGLSMTVIDGQLHVLRLDGRGPVSTLDETGGMLELKRVRSLRDVPSALRFTGCNFLTHTLHRGETSLDEDTAAGEREWLGAVENDAQAQGRAEAQAEWFRHRGSVWKGTVEGAPRLRPGQQVRFSGNGRALDGEATVTRVTHRLDGLGGFTTEFSTEPPELCQRSAAGPIAAYGRVTRLDDPEGQGRVQVALPAYSDVELGWLRVLTLGAGKKKGLVILPDIDEDVLVLFPSGDPAQAVVLGGIYGRTGHPEWGIEKRAVRRFALTSGGGQKITLSDAAHAIVLENDAGSLIEIGEKKIRVESRGDLEIAAPGKAVRIVAKTVDFIQG